MPSDKQTDLLELYNGITTDLEAYLDKADDPNKTPEELAKESYESLDRFNEKLVPDFGDEYGNKHKLQYPFLKAKLREVSGLEKRIETAGDADKEKLSRELETLQRTIQGYLGLLCEDIGAPDSEGHNFMTEHPEYEYLKSVHHYEKADISGIQDAWSQGGGSEKSQQSIASSSLRRGFGDSAIAICEGKGIIFE
ncbi:hypothetical protein PG995_004654 [Apiospora arundinis]